MSLIKTTNSQIQSQRKKRAELRKRKMGTVTVRSRTNLVQYKSKGGNSYSCWSRVQPRAEPGFVTDGRHSFIRAANRNL